MGKAFSSWLDWFKSSCHFKICLNWTFCSCFLGQNPLLFPFSSLLDMTTGWLCHMSNRLYLTSRFYLIHAVDHQQFGVILAADAGVVLTFPLLVEGWQHKILIWLADHGNFNIPYIFGDSDQPQRQDNSMHNYDKVDFPPTIILSYQFLKSACIL